MKYEPVVSGALFFLFSLSRSLNVICWGKINHFQHITTMKLFFWSCFFFSRYNLQPVKKNKQTKQKNTGQHYCSFVYLNIFQAVLEHQLSPRRLFMTQCSKLIFSQKKINISGIYSLTNGHTLTVVCSNL